MCSTELCKHPHEVMEQTNCPSDLLNEGTIVWSKSRGDEKLEEFESTSDGTNISRKYKDGKLRYEHKEIGYGAKSDVTHYKPDGKVIKYTFIHGVLSWAESEELLGVAGWAFKKTMEWQRVDDSFVETLKLEPKIHISRSLSAKTGVIYAWEDIPTTARMEWDKHTGCMTNWKTTTSCESLKQTEWKWSETGHLLKCDSAIGAVCSVFECIKGASLYTASKAMSEEIHTDLPVAPSIKLHVKSNIPYVTNMVVTCSNHGAPVHYCADVGDVNVQVWAKHVGTDQHITITSPTHKTDVRWFYTGELERRVVHFLHSKESFKVKYHKSGCVCGHKARDATDYKYFNDGIKTDMMIDLCTINATNFIGCNPVSFSELVIRHGCKPDVAIKNYKFDHFPAVVATVPKVPIEVSHPKQPSLPPLPTVPVATLTSAVTVANAEQESECSICMEERKDATLSPCGHLCVCVSCAGGLISKPFPICRTVVKSFIKTYTC